MDAKERKELDVLEQRAKERLEEDARLRSLRNLREAEEARVRDEQQRAKQAELMKPRPESGGMLALCQAWNAASE